MIYPGITVTNVACVTIPNEFPFSINIFNWIKQNPISIAKFECIPYIRSRFEGLFRFKWYSKVQCNGTAYLEHSYVEGKSTNGTYGRASAIKAALGDFIFKAVKLELISKIDAPNLICRN